MQPRLRRKNCGPFSNIDRPVFYFCTRNFVKYPVDYSICRAPHPFAHFTKGWDITNPNTPPRNESFGLSLIPHLAQQAPLAIGVAPQYQQYMAAPVVGRLVVCQVHHLVFDAPL